MSIFLVATQKYHQNNFADLVKILSCLFSLPSPPFTMSFKFGNRRPGANAKAALMPEITVGKEEGGNSRSALPKKKSPRNRSTKTSISFDPQKRRDFLTGFRRRKEERRKKAREQIHKDAKEEVKKAR